MTASSTPQRKGLLTRAASGRWVLDDLDLTCGSSIEVRVLEHWIAVTIEHDGRDYYAVPIVIRLHAGLEARRLERWRSQSPPIRGAAPA